jgi:subtilisin family serine protease
MAEGEERLEAAEAFADLWPTLNAWRDKTGSGVRVAVIDSGIDTEHPELKDKVKSSVEVFQQDGKYEFRAATAGDEVGHGTACAGIIARVAPDAELHSIKLMRGYGMHEPYLACLDYAVKQRMQIINLSVGATAKAMYKQLHDILHRAYRAGCIVVSAASNIPNDPTYPSVLTSSIVSVTKQEGTDPLDFAFLPRQVYELAACGVNVETTWPGGGHRQVTGNSFATPHIVGIIARLLEARPDLQPFQVKTLLQALAQQNQKRRAAEASPAPSN